MHHQVRYDEQAENEERTDTNAPSKANGAVKQAIEHDRKDYPAGRRS